MVFVLSSAVFREKIFSEFRVSFIGIGVRLPQEDIFVDSLWDKVKDFLNKNRRQNENSISSRHR